MTKSFAWAWAIAATFTIYITNASGQGKPAPAPAAAPPAKAAPAPAKAETAKEAKPAEPAKPAEMGPPKPGPETKALGFFVGTWNGTGKMEPNAMGPGSPETPTKTKQTCKWTLNNLWVQCDIADTAGTGKSAMTWMGHMIIGYDFDAKSYRAVGADNMGTAFDLNGKMEGTTKFVMESAKEAMMNGVPVKFRFTWDLTDPKAPKFTDERSMKGGPWQLAETTTFKKGG